MSDQDLFARLDAALDAMVAGRAWLLTDTVLVATSRLAERLVARGAQPCFLLAAQPGTGEGPDEDAAAGAISLDLPAAPTMMDSVRQALAALQDLPDEVVQALDAWDPDREARVLGPIFDTGEPVAGRAVFGVREPSWQALEDKTTIDAVWDAIGVERAPSRVVPVRRGSLTQAHEALDAGHGTVWAADMREGFHGGAQGTFHVHEAASLERALHALSASADHARVMPFLEGLPCSIHGLVFPDHVLTTRPAEGLTLRRADGSGFLYCRTSSAWWPGEAIVQGLRDLAVRAGTHLRETLGYRGAFTIDGVWTRRGFRPTELNPRVGAALGQVMPGLDGYLVHTALVEGIDLGVDPRALEAAVRRRSMETWRCMAMVMTNTVFDATQDVRVRWTGDAWMEVPDDAPADATMRWGPAGTGGIVFCTHHPDALSFGPSLGPQTAAFIRWADDRLGTEIGEVVAAPWP